jgi:2-polyprenyl-3-methyl-5-hydroxy-6-metoxy-1,4-benzoquinol methylase
MWERTIMRLGYELGYVKNITKPSDLKNPDNCPLKLLTDKERLYLRIFGLPDTVKQQQAREVFSILGRMSISSVLDVGCAQGHYSVRIARRYPNSQVKGTDFNEEKLDTACLVKKAFGLRNLTFEKTDVCPNDTREKYDLVLLLQVIEHLEDDRTALARIRQVVDEKGHLIITAPNIHSWIIEWNRRHLTVAGHFREGYSDDELARMVTEASFKIEEIKHISGTIGQFVERLETYLKLNFPLLFPLSYPFLYLLTFFDDRLRAKAGKNTSGILILAVATDVTRK